MLLPRPYSLRTILGPLVCACISRFLLLPNRPISDACALRCCIARFEHSVLLTMAAEGLAAFLARVEGASLHDAAWLEKIEAALTAEGITSAAELSGAKFDDFAFQAAGLNGSQKRLVRAAIKLATREKAGTAARSAQTEAWAAPVYCRRVHRRRRRPLRPPPQATPARRCLRSLKRRKRQGRCRRSARRGHAASTRQAPAVAHVDTCEKVVEIGLADFPKDLLPR